MQRFFSVNEYYKKRFGGKLYKIALSAGCTCPNRDGTKGTDGCIFCLGGSGAFAETEGDIDGQIERAVLRLKSKADKCIGFVAYFQSYTNTYGDTARLEDIFTKAAQNKRIAALSIGTRPDCLENDKTEMLKRLNRIKPVTVELGLQTSNERTARLINRCYENECYVDAVKRLKGAGIEVVTHVIIGLPGETGTDAVNTVKFACNAGTDGIKLQLLHVLKGTKLAEIAYTPMTMDEYFAVVGECIEHIPAETVIHRLTGDGDKRALIAPEWSGNKHKVLNGMNKYFDEHNIIQGSKVNGQNK